MKTMRSKVQKKGVVLVERLLIDEEGGTGNA
jgi:hypothetical protein